MRAAQHSLESAWHRLFYLVDAGWKIVFSSHCVHMEANKNTGFRKHRDIRDTQELSLLLLLRAQKRCDGVSAETSAVDLTNLVMHVLRLQLPPSSGPPVLGIWAWEGSGYGCKEQFASSAQVRCGPQVSNRW